MEDVTESVNNLPNAEAYHHVDNLRIRALRPLLPPAILIEELPLTTENAHRIRRQRLEIADVLAGRNDRLIVIVGPCSIHDVEAGREYLSRLQPKAASLADDLLIIMRVYFEKPRTVVGWKGLINDPYLDGSFQINTGLRLARRFLVEVVEHGLPAGTEFLDMIIPQFIADTVCWSAIGARTTESQVHRELASGLSMPVGFKNGTGGNVQMAVDAICSARAPHWFPSVTKQGVSAIFQTTGNDTCHIILRGGSRTGPNYEAEQIRAHSDSLKAAGMPPYLMVDCSHGNSCKDHRRQPLVAADLARQISEGNRNICGVMMESHLVEGRQDLRPGVPPVYGQSITDACISWEQTEPVLELLARAVQARRKTAG